MVGVKEMVQLGLPELCESVLDTDSTEWRGMDLCEKLLAETRGRTERELLDSSSVIIFNNYDKFLFAIYCCVMLYKCSMFTYHYVDCLPVHLYKCLLPVFQYLGCIEVFESRGIQVCEEAVKALKAVSVSYSLVLITRYFVL